MSLTHRPGPAASLTQLTFYLEPGVFGMSPPLALHKTLLPDGNIFRVCLQLLRWCKLLQNVFFVQLGEEALFCEVPATSGWPGPGFAKLPGSGFTSHYSKSCVGFRRAFVEAMAALALTAHLECVTFHRTHIQHSTRIWTALKTLWNGIWLGHLCRSLIGL